MPISDSKRSQMLAHLRLLYGEAAEATLQRIEELATRHEPALRGLEAGELWNERTAVLITYGDQVRSAGVSALEAQRQFLLDYQLDEVIDTVHLLPFFPYSSDDGFSVIDYRRVHPDMGDWEDVGRLGNNFRLMFDFVVNHCSQQHDWFRRFLKDEEPFRRYFIDLDPSTDLTAVTRPRSSPLLTPFETADGTKHVWTTFSADQVDLNFGCPELLVEMLDILLTYVEHGAKILRLDAIGFLWKTPGTTCMHLDETHAVVKLMRCLLDELAPGTVVLTETNVPHKENVSYFGGGDEAHMVYQFSLAPLLLDAFLTGDAGPLNGWLAALDNPGGGMTYFNFTASHDGIGVRPLEGLVSQERLDALVQSVRDRQGLVSMRRKPDGSESPYELNVTYFSALNAPGGLPPELHARKFLTSQALMVALRGVPGIYFHSLIGTPNDHEGVRRTGHNRTVNRRKFESAELRGLVEQKGSAQQLIFDGYRHLLATRIGQPAFHPDAAQDVVDVGGPSLVALQRTSLDGNQRILVLANLSDAELQVDLDEMSSRSDDRKYTRDLLSGQRVEGRRHRLGAFETVWLEAE